LSGFPEWDTAREGNTALPLLHLYVFALALKNGAGEGLGAGGVKWRLGGYPMKKAAPFEAA
jgi:hypothetical protein